MSNLSYNEKTDPDVYPKPSYDEVAITLERDWTLEEERKAKWKCVLLPLIVLVALRLTDVMV